MIQLFTELQEKKNVRSNLSALRASLKEATEEQKSAGYRICTRA